MRLLNVLKSLLKKRNSDFERELEKVSKSDIVDRLTYRTFHFRKLITEIDITDDLKEILLLDGAGNTAIKIPYYDNFRKNKKILFREQGKDFVVFDMDDNFTNSFWKQIVKTGDITICGFDIFINRTKMVEEGFEPLKYYYYSDKYEYIKDDDYFRSKVNAYLKENEIKLYLDLGYKTKENLKILNKNLLF